jgi:hypothetical protein
MGGRDGAGGSIGAKSAYETKLRENFKVTDYGGKTIVKVGSSYGIYDFSHKPKSGKDSDYLVNTAKTAKAARDIIDKWNAAKRKRKK